MSPKIYPLTHRQNTAVIVSGMVTVGFGLMWVLIGLNLLAGGGHAQKYMLFALLSVLLYFSYITWRSSRKHRAKADSLRLLVMMDEIGIRWLYYDAYSAAIYDYKENDDERCYVQQDMPWKQILDAYVENPKYYRTIGKLVVELKGEDDRPVRWELPLNYFEDKEIAQLFVDEMLYMLVATR